jgi:hypothetical protein
MEPVVTEEEPSKLKKLKYPEWQREFEAALVDGDPQTLRQRVDAAEAAIFQRLQSIVSGDERTAMRDAVGKLRAIQKSKLGYPDWNKS